MFYDDVYVRYIYAWLQDSGLDEVKTALLSLISSFDNLIVLVTYLLQFFVFFGIIVIVLKIINKGVYKL